MNCKWDVTKQIDYEASLLARAIHDNRWKDVVKIVEHRPAVLLWDSMQKNYNGGQFLEIWEEDRWVGRECLRILLKQPELLKRVSFLNHQFSTFSYQNEEHWVTGPLLGILAGAGERELMKEALEAGLDPDGWIEGSWYESEGERYYFGQRYKCTLSKKEQFIGYQVIGKMETTPLLIAIYKEDVEMVRLLIEHGASFVPDSELCQEYMKELSSWTIRNMLKKAYGGGDA